MVPRLWIRSAVVLRFCRLLAYRDRSCAVTRIHNPRKFQPAIRICDSVGLLDALAHVPFVLDSRLRFLSTDANAPVAVVASRLPGSLYGAFRPLAQSDAALPDLGLLPRSAFSRTSAD